MAMAVNLQKSLIRCFSLVVKPRLPLRITVIRCYSTRLAEVGVLEAPKLQGMYCTGQLFLHRVFGYRGVILFPWMGKMFDRDIAVKGGERVDESINISSSREVKGKSHTYYQVLIDSRDIPHIRVGTESVTFLSAKENRGLYSIPGLDYVGHEDVIPYKTTEKEPIQNHLFEKFLMLENDKGDFVARDTLKEWQEKNHPWLELTDVHRETTDNMRVTVMPFYIGSKDGEQGHMYWWRYSIRLEHLGDENVQLRERHWRIFSLSGTLETVRGRGIIGKSKARRMFDYSKYKTLGANRNEPVFSKQQPAFQYTSHVSLHAPSGHMWGTFKMEREDGSFFECRIPPFSLESKKEDDSSPHGFIV